MFVFQSVDRAGKNNWIFIWRPSRQTHQRPSKRYHFVQYHFVLQPFLWHGSLIVRSFIHSFILSFVHSYARYGRPTCVYAACSGHCTTYGCNLAGAGRCDRCDVSCGLTESSSWDGNDFKHPVLLQRRPVSKKTKIKIYLSIEHSSVILITIKVLETIVQGPKRIIA